MSDNKPIINMVELMCSLIDKLRQPINISYSRHVTYNIKYIITHTI